MVVQLLSPLSVALDALIFLSAGFSALNAYGAPTHRTAASGSVAEPCNAEVGQRIATARPSSCGQSHHQHARLPALAPRLLLLTYPSPQASTLAP